MVPEWCINSACRGVGGSVCAGRETRTDAPHGRGQPARRTRGGGASYALDGLALQERENISTSAVLATGKLSSRMRNYSEYCLLFYDFYLKLLSFNCYKLETKRNKNTKKVT